MKFENLNIIFIVVLVLWLKNEVKAQDFTPLIVSPQLEITLLAQRMDEQIVALNYLYSSNSLPNKEFFMTHYCK